MCGATKSLWMIPGKKSAQKSSAADASPARLSYKDRHELERLPRQIETLEAEIENIHSRMSDPAFYQLAGDEIADTRKRLSGMEDELQTAYRRWEELESSKPA